MRILGPVEIGRGARALTVNRPVWRALLAVLALRAGRPCSAEHLVDALWGEDPPGQARPVLQSHVARLRRALEPDRMPGTPSGLVLTVPGGYALDIDPLAVDAHRFADTTERGLAAADAGRAQTALRHLDAALALWRGRPFPELGDGPYASAQRTRLAELQRTAATARLECLLALGRDGEAVAEAEGLLHDHPLHEPLWAVRALGRYRLGQQAAALSDLERLRRTLADELGIDPSPEVRRLEHALLRQSASLRGPWPLRPHVHDAAAAPPRADATLALPAVREHSRFVGRDEERQRLRAAVAAVREGERRVVLIGGEPGVGKTRLAVEAAREIHAGGGAVLAGRCDERLGVPYQPFVEALSSYVRRCETGALAVALGPMPAHLGRLYPPLLDHGGLSPPPAVDPATDRFRLFEAVAGWLRTLAEQASSLVVLVDDVHWATAETVQLVRHLARTPDLSVLLLATYRDTELAPGAPWTEALPELRTSPGAAHLPLGGLDAADVRDLLLVATGSDDARAAALAKPVHDVTKGNPFFVEELVAHLAEGDPAAAAPHDGDRAARLLTDLGEPQGVLDVVARRLDGLRADTVEVLHAAAVAGPEWDVATMAAVVGDDARVLDAVDDALRAALLREVDEADPTYAFSHEFVRHVLEAQLTAARRQGEHLRVADALEQVHGPSRAGTIADHLRRAGAAVDLDRVVSASLAAAAQAWQHAAFAEASAHCEAAIALLDERGGDPADVARLRQTLGEAMYATQIASNRGLEQLEAARKTFEQLGDDRSAAVVRTRIARFCTTFFSRIDVARARSELEAALALLEPQGPSPALAEALTILAAAAGWDLRADVARDASLRALEISRRFDDDSACLTAQALAGLSLLADGDLADGQRLMAQAHAEAVERSDPLATWIAAYAYALSGNLLQDPSGWYGWVEHELASGRYESAAGLRTALLGLLADWSLAQGRLDDAERLHAELPAGPGSSPWLRPSIEGRWDDAARASLDAAVAALGTDDRNSGTVALWWASRAREHQGRTSDALALAARAVDLLPGHPPAWATVWMHGRLAVLLAERDRPRALAHLEACEQAAASGEDQRGLAGLVALARAATADSPEQADAAYAAARRAYRRVGHRLFEIDALSRWAVATGRVEHLDAACDLATRAELGRGWHTYLFAARSGAARR